LLGSRGIPSIPALRGLPLFLFAGGSPPRPIPEPIPVESKPKKSEKEIAAKKYYKQLEKERKNKIKEALKGKKKQPRGYASMIRGMHTRDMWEKQMEYCKEENIECRDYLRL